MQHVNWFRALWNIIMFTVVIFQYYSWRNLLLLYSGSWNYVRLSCCGIGRGGHAGCDSCCAWFIFLLWPLINIMTQQLQWSLWANNCFSYSVSLEILSVETEYSIKKNICRIMKYPHRRLLYIYICQGNCISSCILYIRKLRWAFLSW